MLVQSHQNTYPGHAARQAGSLLLFSLGRPLPDSEQNSDHVPALLRVGFFHTTWWKNGLRGQIQELQPKRRPDAK